MKSGFEDIVRVYCFMADSSSKMLLSWMEIWNTAVRRTIRWSGGSCGPVVEMLIELLVACVDNGIG